MIAVVAGIVEHDGKIMLCKRKPGGDAGSKWEFPGGKLEMGETPEQALARELREELDIDVEVGRIFAAKRVTVSRDLLILFYFARILRGTPRAIECDAVEFVEREALCGYDLAGADALVACELNKNA